MKMLLYPFEEQFNVPALSVEFCDHQSFVSQMVGKEALSLAYKYGFKHVLDERTLKRTLDYYWEQTAEKRDLKRHLKEMSAW
jgi:hypothetical protein